MSNDNLQDRGNAMEELFFHNHDKQLIARMRAELEAKESREALAAATGINDESVLNQLVQQGIGSETLATVGLIPLVAVAWADGKMDAQERHAVLRAAEEAGISKGQASLDVLQQWLNHRPEAQLLDSWKAYIRSLCATLDRPAVEQLRNSIVGRARKVAQSAGGFLGVVGTIDKSEKKLLDELERAFDA